MKHRKTWIKTLDSAADKHDAGITTGWTLAEFLALNVALCSNAIENRESTDHYSRLLAALKAHNLDMHAMTWKFVGGSQHALVDFLEEVSTRVKPDILLDAIRPFTVH